MRLIDTTTLELCSIMDESEIPPYAILSHTWGADEVTLQQFTDQSSRSDKSSLKSSRGYWKILKASQQALKDGLSLLWVDTCCIDKTSSSELSEAINSMFRWYRDASVCYAYLNDVDVYVEAGANWNVRFSEDQLAMSRWFTRGWTLQELLAPSHLVFYGKEWRFIGHKSFLYETIERITGIDAAVLSGERHIGDESIAKRMSWMARRTTTRSEDMAYSLMGIFDVNMPLLYGEGEKAFVRLQEEIMKDSADHSLFAWEFSSSRLLNDLPRPVFASHPKHFSGTSRICNRRFDDVNRLEDSYSLTNRGLRIKLRIRPYNALGCIQPTETFVAVLECCYEDPELKNCWPSIVIRRLPGSKSQYVRIPSAGIVPVTFGPADHGLNRRDVLSLGEVDDGEWIYIRKIVPGWA